MTSISDKLKSELESTKDDILKEDKIKGQSGVEDEESKASETLTKKKKSPFLVSEVKAEDEEVSQEESTSKKQHEIIDNLAKESSIFNSTGKLYFFSSKTNKPETRGEGKFLILKDKSEMYKLTMIRDKVMLKGCNHYISPNCPLTKATQAKNSWIWTALGDQSDAEKNEEKTVYFAMFKDAETSDEFEKKYNQAKAENLELLNSAKKI